MDSSAYIFIAVLGPFTFAAMITTSIYMKVQTRRLSQEIQKKGLVVYTLPIFVTGGINDEPRPPLVSPLTGLPPPPPYTRTVPSNTQTSAPFPSGPPPSYNSNPAYVPTETCNVSPPAYEMSQVQNVNEIQRSA